MNNKKNKSVILYYILIQQINIDDDDVLILQVPGTGTYYYHLVLSYSRPSYHSFQSHPIQSNRIYFIIQYNLSISSTMRRGGVPFAFFTFLYPSVLYFFHRKSYQVTSGEVFFFWISWYVGALQRPTRLYKAGGSSGVAVLI